MASLKQLRDIFAPILAEHPDLVLRGRWLFRPPIESAIIGLYIGRTAYASDSHIALSVLPLSRFVWPSALGYSERFEVERAIGAPPTGHSIQGTDEQQSRVFFDMFAPEYQAHLLRNFNAKVPAFLDAVRSFDDILAWVRPFLEPGRGGGGPDLTASWLATMQGDFAAASERLQTFSDRMSQLRFWANSEERRDLAILRDVLLTGDRTAVADFLHGMEAQTIAHHQLQRFWRRTPFPFEQY